MKTRSIVRMFAILILGVMATWQTVAAADGRAGVVQLEVFVRSDKPSAGEVAVYLEELKRRIPGIEVLTRDVVKERPQLKRLYVLTKKAGRSKPVVPSFYCCDRMYFGFEGSAKSGPLIEDLFTADVYTRRTCPRCADAKVFIRGLKQRWPAIQFRIHEVDVDAVARARWDALCRGAGSAPGLPTIDFGGHVIIGYRGDDTTGAELEELIGRKARVQAEAPTQPDPSARAQVWMGPVSSLLDVLQVSNVPDSDAVSNDVDDADFDQEWVLPDEATEDETGLADVNVESTSTASPEEVIDVPVFGELKVRDLGMPLFSFLVGLVDGFNPCAMWVLVFLLSVLVNIKDRRKIILIAGTFVLVSGMAYFAFMAAWLNLFLLIGIARPVQIVLGVLGLVIGVVNVKDFFAFKKGVSLSIPESKKPGLYRRVRQIVDAKYLTVAISGAIALAVVVNMIELLCTAGLPALYTQILTLQELPPWQNYAYLTIYITAYMLDDAVLLTIVVATLSHRKLQEREGRWLKLLSGLVILALGLVMIFRPELLQLGH
ncbi:glutaredoxin family protein [Neorhodopirellula lusitana]|uniref:glutaredoxin family protein n=1 Tax=Neorhodopirellula lusitana TaxID=445327 RepID=UPI00384DAAC8